MWVGSAFLKSLFWTVDLVLGLIVWFVFVWVILSWVVFFASQTSFRWRHRAFFNVLVQLNDFFERGAAPILRPFRRLLPPWKTGGIDWSPLLLLIAVYFLRTFLRLAIGPIL